MQTPSALYAPSPRLYPARVPEPDYGDAMRVRTVRQGGVLCWKHQNVFLTEVLDGERVGLLPIDDRFFTIFFAEFPIARFDSHRRVVLPLPKREVFYQDEAGEGDQSPSPPPHPLSAPEQKV